MILTRPFVFFVLVFVPPLPTFDDEDDEDVDEDVCTTLLFSIFDVSVVPGFSDEVKIILVVISSLLSMWTPPLTFLFLPTPLTPICCLLFVLNFDDVLDVVDFLLTLMILLSFFL